MSAKFSKAQAEKAEQDGKELRSALQTKLANTVAAFTSSKEWLAFLNQAKRLGVGRFSANNQMLLLIQMLDRGLDYGRVATYQGWQQIDAADGSKCQVAKGAKSLKVFKPVKVWKEEPTATDPKAGRWIVVNFRLLSEFHEADLVTPPVAEPDVEPKHLTGSAPAQLWENLAAIATADGWTLTRQPSDHGENGWTLASAKQINVTDKLEGAQAVKTLAHEIAHKLLGHGEPGNRTPREMREVEAESVACLVLAEYGVDSFDYSVPYLASWSSHVDKPEKVVAFINATAARVLETAEKISEHLAGTAPAEDETPTEAAA